MHTADRWSPIRAAGLATVAFFACRGDTAAKPPADSAASAAVAQPETASQAAAAKGEATPVSVGPEPQTTCAAVAGFWRRYASTDVRQLDSLVKSYVSGTTVNACVVLVSQEHSPLRDPKAPVDTATQHLETALALVHGAGPGWVALLRYGADGPDGSSLAYQRGRVRCLVEASWDGGDDSDSTYVPADWYKDQTTCWMMPGELTVSDTAMGP